MILVTGASGGLDGAVLRELLSRDVKSPRAMYRSEKDRSAAPAGAEGIVADFADAASLDKALKGVDSAYLVCAAVPDLVQLETNFLQACDRAKVGFVVIQSAFGAGDFGKSFPSWHRQVEDAAANLKLPHAILRPNGFMQNILNFFAPTIRAQNAFYGTTGDAKTGFIDTADIPAAAVQLLTKPKPGALLELHGPEPVSYPELATRISGITGRSIRYVNIPCEQMRAVMMGNGLPVWLVTALLDLDEFYRSGKGAGSDRALAELLGRAPHRLDQFLKEQAEAFKKI
jgi:uncharacterized protein YbjT (DUF2867 family)